jgi:hypothetical protein
MTFRLLVYAAVALAAASRPAAAQTTTFQGTLPAGIHGPRKVSVAGTGDVFVTDSGGRLYRLTRYGQVVGQVLENVISIAAGQSEVFAATNDGQVVRLDGRTGRVKSRFKLGLSQVPAGLAWDAARGKLWLAYGSGLVEARGVDGTKIHEILPSSGMHRLAGVTLDGQGNVWVAQDRTGSGGMVHAFDATTGVLRQSVPVNGVRVMGGVATAANDDVLVSDLFSGNVQVIGSTATTPAPVATVGTYGTAQGQLSQPTGVATLINGDMVVANMDANRLDRFGAGAPIAACPGDADCDGLPDAWELANGLNPNDPSDAYLDPDHDGLNNVEEYLAGTNPRLIDTDGDGYSDAAELASGFDPNDANDHRPKVVLDAPSSSDPGLVRLSATVRDPTGERGACTVDWKQVSGAPVVLKGSNTSAPSFVARKAGDYGFEALGSCGKAKSVPTKLTVAIANATPRANGGRTVTLPVGGSLSLSGLFSADGNGDALAFQWDQMVGPPVVAGASGSQLTAQLDQPGYYVFRLGATDGAGAEGTTEVPVLVLGDAAAPVARAATPVEAVAGQAVTLDATASSGAALTYVWQQVSGKAVTLDGAASAVATFVPPAPGRYGFEVAVQDGALQAPPARVEVFAAAAGGSLPVASASAPRFAAVDVPVTLDGTGSVGAGGLVYEWRQVSGPAAGLTRADRAAATVVLFQGGSYEFELAVSDVSGSSVPARVRIEGRARGAAIPVAVANAPASAQVGDLVLLEGRASSAAMNYRWTQVAGPWVVVNQGSMGSFVPKAAGTYGFELEVDDGAIRSAPVRVNVVVTP